MHRRQKSPDTLNISNDREITFYGVVSSDPSAERLILDRDPCVGSTQESLTRVDAIAIDA